ncbi:MAG: hypothetical protein HYR55_09380 [Acidobacteria bacterium]|nr:hypothetical protein [Acidobacteriota bacterium]MBI3657700.1 hypothetical protein [Acidobacteriota bacterium]
MPKANAGFIQRMIKKSTHDDDYLWSYFQQCVARFENLPAPADPVPSAYTNAAEIVQRPTITWDDVYTLELALLYLEPSEQVRRRIWTLRAEYRELVGEADYAEYDASTPPDPATADLMMVRADAAALMHETQWRYNVLWGSEVFRGRLGRRILQIVGGILPIFLFAAIYLVKLCGASNPWSVLLLVMFAGTLGGATSTFRRIQTADLDGNLDLNMLKLERSNASIYASPLLGTVFALMLYLLFVGGLVQGALFPEFAEKTTASTSQPCGWAAWRAVPADAVTYAKLLVWSFIAGFAEKFVPDRLDKLANEKPAEVKGKATETTGAPAGKA